MKAVFADFTASKKVIEPLGFYRGKSNVSVTSNLEQENVFQFV